MKNLQFQENFLSLFNQYDDPRRLKVISGMRQQLLQGEWIGRSPLGYEYVITTEGKRIIVVNETGELLRKAFLWKAHEETDPAEILQRLKLHGLKLTKQAIDKALSNPFYCGILSYSLLNGEVIEGKHEKLISKEIFLKVNNKASICI